MASTAAVIVFWPAAFFVGGDKQTAAELAQMKGQMVCRRASFDREKSVAFSFRMSIHRELDASAIRQLVELGLTVKAGSKQGSRASRNGQ